MSTSTELPALSSVAEMSTAGNPQGLFGLWVVLGKVFSEFCQSESWAVLLAQSDLWESVFVLVNIVIALLLGIAYLFFTIRTVQKKHSPRYQPRAYISPLNIAKEFRERWRTRWKHQAYHVFPNTVLFSLYM